MNIQTRAFARPIALLLSLLASTTALAGPADKIYAPIVEKGETEFELRGGFRNYGGQHEYATIFDIGHAVTDYWMTELVLEYSGASGEGGRIEAIEWENLFVFTERGEHWMDVGLLVEYEHTYADGPDEIKIGPLLMKEIGPTIVNLNLSFKHEVGSGSSDETELGYGWQVKWRGSEALEFGLQGLGSLGTVDHPGRDGEHSIGPALFGVQRLGNGNKIAYDAAILAGLTNSAPDSTVRFQLEYEMY